MECSVRRHDEHQFEVKVGYPLDRAQAMEEFGLDLFLFFPYQLRVHSATYPHTHFYSDLRSYTRFKTPELPPADVLNPENPASPLTRLRRGLAEGKEGAPWQTNRLTYELKALGSILNVQMREGTRRLRHLAERKGAAASEESVAEAVRFLDEVESVIAALRSLRADILHAAPTSLAEAYPLVDEHVSMRAEWCLFQLLTTLDERVQDSPLRALRGRLVADIRRENDYRRDHGYAVVDAANPRRNERFLHRENLLKTYCASALFLTEDKDTSLRRAHQFLYGVAAALATAFATVAALLAGWYYPEDSPALVVLLMLVYVAKDRIKEFLRDYGGRLLPRLTGDRHSKLTDPEYAQTVGHSSERMTWPHRDDVPSKVLALRRSADPLKRAVVERTEVVLHYAKHVHISPRTIYAYHQRAVAVDEILRLHVGEWLEAMDSARQNLLHLTEDAQGVLSLPSTRVYQVPVIVRLAAHSTGATEMTRATLILSRNGIERVEPGLPKD